MAEPTVALAAVLALSFGLAAYAAVLGGVETVASLSAGPTLERIHEAVTVGGVADPERLAGATRRADSGGGGVNATLTAAGRRWTAGRRGALLRHDRHWAVEREGERKQKWERQRNRERQRH
jgi:hypothetical protein